MSRRKVGGRDFVKGKPGGPGRPPLLPELKGKERLHRDDVNRLINEALNRTPAETEEVLNNPETPLKVLIFANVAKNAALLGDMGRMIDLLNYVVGPIKQEVQHDINLNLPDPELDQLAIRMYALRRQDVRLIDGTKKPTS